jgi:hypothetical protein
VKKLPYLSTAEIFVLSSSFLVIFDLIALKGQYRLARRIAAKVSTHFFGLALFSRHC